MAGWWAALPYVCVPLLVYRDEDALAYVTADLAPPGARSERHLLAFEDRRDAGAVQALFAVRSPPDAGVQVCPPLLAMCSTPETGFDVRSLSVRGVWSLRKNVAKRKV